MSIRSQKKCVQCFRILSDKTRLRMLAMLRRDMGNTVNAITKHVGVSQPTVSHHLHILAAANLVTRERRGREMVYRFNPNYPCRGCGVFSLPIRL